MFDCHPEMGYQGSYTFRKLAEGELTPSVQPMIMLSSGFPTSPAMSRVVFHELENCLCMNAGQDYIPLRYFLLGLQDDRVISMNHSTAQIRSYNDVEKYLCKVPTLE